MKKNIAIFLLMIMSVVAFTGCGKTNKESKKLVCTMNVSGVDVTYNIDFEGDKVKGMDFAYDMDLSSYSDAQIKAIESQDFCPTVEKAFANFGDAFQDCKQKVAKKQLNVTAKLVVDKLASNVKELMVSQEKAKDGIEAMGFKCSFEK